MRVMFTSLRWSFGDKGMTSQQLPFDLAPPVEALAKHCAACQECSETRRALEQRAVDAERRLARYLWVTGALAMTNAEVDRAIERLGRERCGK